MEGWKGGAGPAAAAQEGLRVWDGLRWEGLRAACPTGTEEGLREWWRLVASNSWDWESAKEAPRVCCCGSCVSSQDSPQMWEARALGVRGRVPGGVMRVGAGLPAALGPKLWLPAE